MLGCLGVSGWCLGGVWGCLDGVWIVSKCFLNRPFIKIPYNKGCFEVSAGCLWGVCGVSVGYLDGVWGSLDIVWEVETQNQLKTIQ